MYFIKAHLVKIGLGFIDPLKKSPIFYRGFCKLRWRGLALLSAQGGSWWSLFS